MSYLLDKYEASYVYDEGGTQYNSPENVRAFDAVTIGVAGHLVYQEVDGTISMIANAPAGVHAVGGVKVFFTNQTVPNVGTYATTAQDVTVHRLKKGSF